MAGETVNALDANHIQQPAMTPGTESQITRRWEEWQPALIMEARRTPDPATALSHFKIVHRSRCIHLTSAGIRWRVILRNQLDSPLHSDERFEILLRAALHRTPAERNYDNRRARQAVVKQCRG